jgi:hypothetical protein
MSNPLTIQEEAILFGVLTNAGDSLRRLETAAAGLCRRKDVSLYFRPVKGRPTRRAFPVLFCEPTKTFMKYLKAARAFEIKYGRVKRTAAKKRA